jgi:hypothetical protein
MKQALASFAVAGAAAAVILLGVAVFPQLLFPLFLGYVCLTALGLAVYDYSPDPLHPHPITGP